LEPVSSNSEVGDQCKGIVLIYSIGIVSSVADDEYVCAAFSCQCVETASACERIGA
jgi:hypothetical protein